jgi:hypothetical protein
VVTRAWNGGLNYCYGGLACGATYGHRLKSSENPISSSVAEDRLFFLTVVFGMDALDTFECPLQIECIGQEKSRAINSGTSDNAGN